MTFIDVGPINNKKETNWAYMIRPYILEFTYFQLLGFEGVIKIGCGSRGLWLEGDMKVNLSITQYQQRPMLHCDSVVVAYQQTRSRC